MKRLTSAICTSAAAALVLAGCSSTTNGSLFGGDSNSPSATASAGFPASSSAGASDTPSGSAAPAGESAQEIADALDCTDVKDEGPPTSVGSVTPAENVTCTLDDVPVGIITFSSAADAQAGAQALKDAYGDQSPQHAVLAGETWMLAVDNDDLAIAEQRSLLTEAKSTIGGEIFEVGRPESGSTSPSAGKGYRGEYPDADSLATALDCKITQRFDPADVEQLQGTAPVEAAQCEGAEWTYVLEIWDSAETSNDALISWSTKIAKGRVDVITLGDVWWVRTTKHRGVEATEAELHSNANTLKATLGGEIVNIPQ